MDCNIKYAFLKSIYVDENDVGIYYEAEVSDTIMAKTGIMIKTLAEWKELFSKQSITANFSFEDDYLKCSPDIPRYPIAGMISSSEDTSIFNESNKFYYFIFNGIVNKYILCEDGIALSEDSSYHGTEITEFSSIKFSKSTMTMYAMLNSENGFYNKVLIYLSDVDLVINKFYYGIPKDAENIIPMGKFIKDMDINNNEYAIYCIEPEDVQLICNVTFSENLIALSVVLSQKFKDIVDVLGMYYKCSYQTLVGNTDDTEKQWCGGSSSYASRYGVYMETSLAPLSEYQIDALCGYLYKLEDTFAVHHSVDKLLEEIDSLDLNTRSSDVLRTLVPIIFSENGSKEDFLTLLRSSLKSYESIYCIYNLYLYCIRINAYLQKKHVGNLYGQINNPITRNSIMLREVFWYAI